MRLFWRCNGSHTKAAVAWELAHIVDRVYNSIAPTESSLSIELIPLLHRPKASLRSDAERAEDEGDAHESAERAEDSCIALARTRKRQRSRRINPRCVTFAVGVHAGCELEGLGVAEQVEGVG